MDYGIQKFFGLTLPVKFWIHQFCNSKICISHLKIHHSKKAFQIHQSVTEICILDSEIYNSKKSILDPPIRNRIRLPDSAIQKSIIYAKIASGTPLIQKKNIQF